MEYMRIFLEFLVTLKILNNVFYLIIPEIGFPEIMQLKFVRYYEQPLLLKCRSLNSLKKIVEILIREHGIHWFPLIMDDVDTCPAETFTFDISFY